MDIRQQTVSIISEQLGVPVEELTPSLQFRSLPDVDSMRVLQIILETEKAFGIEIADEVTFQIETIGEFQSLVEDLCRQKAPK